MRIGQFFSVVGVVLTVFTLISVKPASSSENSNTLIVRSDMGAAILNVRQTPYGKNSAEIVLSGRDALSTAPFWQRSGVLDLAPNTILQDGSVQTMKLLINGEANQIAVSQIGADSNIILNVSGRANISTIQQNGVAETASISQIGAGNMVVIAQ